LQSVLKPKKSGILKLHLPKKKNENEETKKIEIKD